ncbi:splicing factor C9orf78 [Culicoides brevitarsis]|uniref:splicing factor C9orf78 n=1 Tax=Culicoides brevitarsis TaxID=469753 RepID=UPI00307C20EF
MSEETQEIKPLFKSRKTKNARQIKKPITSGSEDEEDNSNEDLLTKINEMKDKQKLRQKPNGINVIGLALGKKITTEEEIVVKDPLNCKIGGMLNMQKLKMGELKTLNDASDIGTQFSAETNIRDQDEEMMKYIEDQLRKKKGENKSEEEKKEMKKYLTPEESALLALPEHLRQTSVQKSEEMLSNQMLSGIPEVDLGIEAKIKNIEATEEAKQKMIQDQKKQKEGPSFVPVNMATNFATHNDRYNLDSVKRKREEQKDKNFQTKRDAKKATDDFYYDKFRSKFRKH